MTLTADPDLASVHTFSFRGRRFAYFVRTGDLVELGDEAFLALSLVEDGADAEERERRIRAELGDRAPDVLRDLEALERDGLLRPESRAGEDERDDFKRALLRHQPRNLMFFVTEKCNLACTYCYEKNQGVHAEGRTLKQVDARRIIDRYFEGSPGRRGLTITFFGGEPLLNPDVIRDTVAYAKEKGAERGTEVAFTMTTNLTLLTEDMAEFLAREEFHVMVSLDGDRENNDRHRVTVKGEGTYDTVVANLKILIERMKAHGVRLPKIRSTLTAESDTALATEAHLQTLGTPLVEVGETHGTVIDKQPYDVHGEVVERAQTEIEERIDRLLAELEADPEGVPEIPRSMHKTLTRIHGEITREYAHERVQPSLCGVCRNMKAVTPGGDLYPCHRYVGMPEFKVGNMHRGGIDREKVGAYYDRIQDVFAETCEPCWLRHLCGGQCPWYLSADDGTIRPPDEETCDHIRSAYERQLGLYATLLRSYPNAFRAYTGTPAEDLSGCCDPQPADPLEGGAR